MFPEATISRSFELKEFKPGAVRMAQAAGVPVIPTITWGGQRIYTKARPAGLPEPGKGDHRRVRRAARRRARRDDGELVALELRSRMDALLHQVRQDYPQQPAGDDDRWWLPASMGGTAPTPQEASALDSAEAAARGASAPEEAAPE